MAKADEWLQKVEKELEKAKKNGQVSESVTELVNELRIHQSELEMQNEELKQSQEEYAQLYNKYLDLYNDVPVGYFTLDKEGIIRNVNDKGAELLKHYKERIIGRGFSRFIPKAEEGKYYHALGNSIDTRKNQEVELQLKRSGMLFDAHMEILPLFNRDGSRYRVIITDITERKKAEEREELLKTLMDNNPSLVFMKDKEGRYVYLNKSYEKQFIHSKDWYGKTDFDFWPKESAELFQANDAEVLESGKIQQFMEDSTDMDGTRYVWLNYKFPFIDSKGEKFVGGIGIDATARVVAEEALKESEKLYHEFFDNPLNGFALCEIITDNKGNPVDFVYLEINEAFEKFTGLKREDVLNKKVTEILVPEEVADVIQIYGKVALTGEQTLFQYPIPSLGKWYEVAAFSPRKKQFIAFFTDITERKKAEEKLKESEMKYRGWFEGDLTGDFVATPDGKLIECNPAFLDVYGFKSRSMALQYNISQFNTESWIDLIALLKDKRVIIGGQSWHKRPDGKRIHVIANVLGVFNELDELAEIRGYVFDDTDRKKAEEELKQAHDTLEGKVKERTSELEEAYKSIGESEEKYRELFNNVNDMITLSEIEANGMPGKYIEVNEVGVKRMGYSKEEFLNLSPVDIVAPEYRAEMPKNAVVMAEKGRVNFEIVQITKDGKRIPIEVNGHIINYKGRKTYLTVSRDITERKIAEEKLKETINELERSNQELQQFAYVSSHDLQEPLRTIASFTQLLERRYKGQLDADADEFMDFIVEAAIRMKEQIEGLLEYSRVGTKGEEFQPVNLNEILKSTIKVLNSSFEESKAKITFDELPTIMGDADQLLRVFQNLLSNAIKFRKSEEPLTIHISFNKDINNNEYIFSVQDNGIGIEEQYSERIFTIFQRLHTREIYKGTGIGLSIVKRIIERHGGRVWVESEFGVGTTFYFTIPAE